MLSSVYGMVFQDMWGMQYNWVLTWFLFCLIKWGKWEQWEGKKEEGEREGEREKQRTEREITEPDNTCV